MKAYFAADTVLKMPEMTDDEFFDFCRDNSDYRIERTAKGGITIMPGTGGRTGNRNIRISRHLDTWAEKDGRGIAFDSSTMFLLPSGAMRSPDGAWVARERLRSIPAEQRDRFVPLSPEFVIELRSPSDGLAGLMEKMDEWMANGSVLGWLIDPAARTVRVYRGPGEPELLADPAFLEGEGPLAGFRLDLGPVWDPGW